MGELSNLSWGLFRVCGYCTATRSPRIHSQTFNKEKLSGSFLDIRSNKLTEWSGKDEDVPDLNLNLVCKSAAASRVYRFPGFTQQTSDWKLETETIISHLVTSRSVTQREKSRIVSFIFFSERSPDWSSTQSVLAPRDLGLRICLRKEGPLIHSTKSPKSGWPPSIRTLKLLPMIVPCFVPFPATLRHSAPSTTSNSLPRILLSANFEPHFIFFRWVASVVLFIGINLKWSMQS